MGRNCECSSFVRSASYIAAFILHHFASWRANILDLLGSCFSVREAAQSCLPPLPRYHIPPAVRTARVPPSNSHIHSQLGT
jgi:hypothetical protein